MCNSSGKSETGNCVRKTRGRSMESKVRDNIEYTLIRSSRKTISLQLREAGEKGMIGKDRVSGEPGQTGKGDVTVIVRAPRHMALRDIDAFVERHRSWIERRTAQLAQARQNKRVISDREREEGIRAAKEQIPRRVAYFARQMGVTYGRITIREQKTRWGSCSSKGNLNFNWKLMLMPEEILDYVVVHELAHRREMNHSERFWTIVAEMLPDYRERRRRLKEWGRRV